MMQKKNSMRLCVIGNFIGIDAAFGFYVWRIDNMSSVSALYFMSVYKRLCGDNFYFRVALLNERLEHKNGINNC